MINSQRLTELGVHLFLGVITARQVTSRFQCKTKGGTFVLYFLTFMGDSTRRLIALFGPKSWYWSR